MCFFVSTFIFRTLERAGWERIVFEDATKKKSYKKKKGKGFLKSTKTKSSNKAVQTQNRKWKSLQL